MGRFSICCRLAAGAALCLMMSVACEDLMDQNGGKGSILINFDDGTLPGGSPLSETSKSKLSLPDTNSFILKVSSSDGDVLYDGTYGAAPKELTANAGAYCIETYSREFSEPVFEAPQFGDVQSVKVESGKTARVILNCTQQNAGLRIKVDKSFSSAYPDGNLYAVSSDGRLLYGYSETRTGFFKAGTIRVMLSSNGKEENLFSRNLSSQQIMTLRLSAGSTSEKSGIGIKVDTSRIWDSEDVEVDVAVAGTTIQTAFSVSKAKQHIGEENVWVYGYIVGGDLTSSKCSFDAPFTSRTNIVIAEKSSCRSKQDCLSVQLSQGDVRDVMNLVDNSVNLGRQVFLKGKIVSSYYGIPGIQSISEYQWK